MDIDSGAKAVIETYFNAFDKYVVSLGERFAAYEKHSVENEKLWAKRDEPANGIADTEKFQGWMAEVSREVASMRRMYDEETIYSDAHEYAVSSLSPEQDEIFEQMSAGDIYDLLVENYTEKYRREKFAENEVVITRYKEAVEENARLRREGGRANALSVSDDDVAFAGEQVEIFRQYLEHPSLVDADCRSEAHGIMPIYHANITGNAIEAEREAYRGLSGEEAIDAYQKLQSRYIRDYTHHLIWDWRDARNDVVNAYGAFRDQALDKPSFLSNLFSGGTAIEKWREEGNELLSKARKCSREFEEMDEARHEACYGGYYEDALEDAEKNIRLVYPELHEKVQERQDEVWRETNAKRLEDEAQRIPDDREQSGSRDLSR